MIRTGQEIRDRRKGLRLSREKLASMAGVSTATLRRWEVGEIEPSELVLRGFDSLFPDNPPPSKRTDPAVRPLEKLVLATRILVMEGLIGPFGHVSMRSTRKGKFLIPSHVPADQVSVDDIVEVEIDLTTESVKRRNLYTETFIHSCIYQENPKVQAVAHTHSTYAIALGAMKTSGSKILPTTNPGANLGNFIPVFHGIGLVERPEKGLQIARALRGQNGVLLRGHGAVVVGLSLEQAVLRAIYLEFEARAQMISRNAGKPKFYKSGDSDVFNGSGRNPRATDHAWRYYAEKAQPSGDPGSPVAATRKPLKGKTDD